MCKCTPAGHEVHPQPQQDFFGKKSAPPQTKSWLRLCHHHHHHIFCSKVIILNLITAALGQTMGDRMKQIQQRWWFTDVKQLVISVHERIQRNIHITSPMLLAAATEIYHILDHPRSCVVYNFGRVCLSVCLSVWMYVCQTISFESLDVGSSHLNK